MWRQEFQTVWFLLIAFSWWCLHFIHIVVKFSVVIIIIDNTLCYLWPVGISSISSSIEFFSRANEAFITCVLNFHFISMESFISSSEKTQPLRISRCLLPE